MGKDRFAVSVEPNSTDGAIIASLDAGRTWELDAEISVVGGALGPQALSCALPNRCVVAAGGLAYVTSNGEGSCRQVGIDGIAQAVSCRPAGGCLIATRSAVLASYDFGSSCACVVGLRSRSCSPWPMSAAGGRTVHSHSQRERGNEQQLSFLLGGSHPPLGQRWRPAAPAQLGTSPLAGQRAISTSCSRSYCVCSPTSLPT